MQGYNNSNVGVVAKQSSLGKHFDIYLILPDRQVYLMSHRKNEQLFDILKKGIRVKDMKTEAHKKYAAMSMCGKRYLHGGMHPRLKSHKNRSQHLENMINHIMTVIDEYMKDM